MTTHQPIRRPLLALALALVGALVLTLAPSVPAQAKARTMAEYAHTFRGDGTLHDGCRNYRYKYKINPPEDADTWALETFLTDRRGKTIASGGVLEGADPLKGGGSSRRTSASRPAEHARDAGPRRSGQETVRPPGAASGPARRPRRAGTSRARRPRACRAACRSPGPG